MPPKCDPQTDEEIKDVRIVTVPYVKMISKQARRIFDEECKKVVFKNVQSLNQSLMQAKVIIINHLKQDAAYKLSCPEKTIM